MTPVSFPTQALAYRRINPEADAEQVAANFRDAYVCTYGTDRGYAGGRHYLAWLKARVEEFPDGHVLALLGGRVVGQLELQVPYGSKSGYVNVFYVCPEFRGRGWGTRMHDYTERYFRSWEAETIELHVAANNTAALRFYRKLGYGFDPTDAGQGPMVAMRKRLDGAPRV